MSDPTADPYERQAERQRLEAAVRRWDLMAAVFGRSGWQAPKVASSRHPDQDTERYLSSVCDRILMRGVRQPGGRCSLGDGRYRVLVGRFSP